MSELQRHIENFLEEMKRNSASPHTLRSYATDLRGFLSYFTPPESQPPEAREFDHLKIREWMAYLHGQGLEVVSIRRHIASLRMFFRYLVREGYTELNPAKLVHLPKAPQKLPVVMSAEQTSGLLDNVEAQERPFPKRDLAMLELLYGSGLRVSELVGLNLEDIDRTECWLRVRGKGRKERQVPYTGKATAALETYLSHAGCQAT